MPIVCTIRIPRFAVATAFVCLALRATSAQDPAFDSRGPVVRQPVVRMERVEERRVEPVVRERTYEQTYQRVVYQPIAQVWHRPQMVSWSVGAPQPTMISKAVAVTRWIPKQEVVKVPIVERQMRDEERTYARYERVLGFEERPVEGYPPDPLRDAAYAARPPVAADYLAFRGNDVLSTSGYPGGFSAINGQPFMSPSTGWGGGAWGQGGFGPNAYTASSWRPPNPPMASNSWPTNNWSSSGWPGSPRPPSAPGHNGGLAGTPVTGPFGGLGARFWSAINRHGTLSDSWGGSMGASPGYGAGYGYGPTFGNAAPISPGLGPSLGSPMGYGYDPLAPPSTRAAPAPNFPPAGMAPAYDPVGTRRYGDTPFQAGSDGLAPDRFGVGDPGAYDRFAPAPAYGTP